MPITKNQDDRDRETAKKLLTSMRGRYVISEALLYAIEVLDKIEDRNREQSDIDDMKLLRKLFPLFVKG